MKMRTIYSIDRNLNTRDTGLSCVSVDRTQQHFKQECDINTLVERFGIGYSMPQGLRMPQYGDFSHISNFHEALNQIAAARETFDALPAYLRDRFHNDPGRFVDFAIDPKNVPELEKLGLIKSPEMPPRATETAQGGLPNPQATPPLPAPPTTPQA